MKRTAILAALLATAPALCAAASEEFRWNGKLAAGQAIEIKGVNGGITATGSSGGEVELVAVKKGRRSDPREVKIDVVEHADGVTICAVYPSTDGKANECSPGKAGRMKSSSTGCRASAGNASSRAALSRSATSSRLSPGRSTRLVGAMEKLSRRTVSRPG